MSERKEMSTETRSLLAAVLCLLVIAAWSLIYKPPQPPAAHARIRAATNPVRPAQSGSSASAPAAKAAHSRSPATMRAAGRRTLRS